MVRILVVVGLAWAGPAAAFDIETTSEVWTKTIAGPAGQDGMDAATGLGVDGDGNVTAGGTLDGAAGHGTDGYIVSWDPDGTERWELTVDSGVVGATDSNDRIEDLAVDTTDQVTAVGRLASSGVADGAFWAAAYEPVAGAELWERTILQQFSPDQQAFGLGLSPSNNDPFVVGWSRGDLPGLTGQWEYTRLAKADGLDVVPLSTFDASSAAYNPDQAFDGAMDLGGTFTVVGRAGTDGGSAVSITNDTQFMTRRYDALGALVWSGVLGGSLEDEALAVVIDAFSEPHVAGYENVGTDNAEGRDEDWLVVKYSSAANADGTGAVEWTYTWGTTGANERATAIAVDEDGGFIVAGTAVDSATGNTVWRVVQLSEVDGSQRSERLWPVTAGDSVPYAVAQVSGVAVVAGMQGNADGDFHVSYLASDLDLDGTIDSEDDCPTNGSKTEPGVCGCNLTDLDGDGDGVEDCNDICDGDGDKTEPGICGCGFPDSDDDGDGVPGCDDACSTTPAGVVVDAGGCGPDERGEVDTDTGEVAPPTPDEKGCNTSGAPAGLLGVAFAALAATRRRRS